MSLVRIHNWCKWLGFDMGMYPRIVCFYIFLTKCKVKQSDPLQLNVVTNSENEMSTEFCYEHFEAAYLED